MGTATGSLERLSGMGVVLVGLARECALRSVRVGLLALSLAITWSVAASPVDAQLSCLDCSLCYDPGKGFGGLVGNKAPVGDHTSVHSAGLGSHNHCVMSGDCTEQHPIEAGCLVTREEQEDRLAALDDLVGAVQREDALAAYRVLTDSTLRESARYVVERNAIQVQGCGGAVIAHISLSGSAVLANAAVMASQRARRPWSMAWAGVRAGLAPYLP